MIILKYEKARSVGLLSHSSPYFVGPDFGGHLDREHEDLAVAELARPRRSANGGNEGVDLLVFHDQLELDLRKNIHFNFLTPVFE